MKLLANYMLTAFLICLIAVSYIPSGYARAMESVKSSYSNQNATAAVAQEKNLRYNDTAMTPLPVVQPKVSDSLVHIRKKRETEMSMPFDFHTLHMHCDIDASTRLVRYFPNHCIWIWNNRFSHEGTYRVYKTYQLEAFFFGQYYERLKRFETDPHTWDYGNTGV